MTGLVLVSGLTRSGSSLTMQMLAAGGWPVFDPKISLYPAFEHPINQGRGRLPKGATGIMKWLDPQVFHPPNAIRGSIFLARDPKQQAKSFVKFGQAVGLPIDGAKWRVIAKSFEKDAPRACAVLAACGPVLRLMFEDLIGDTGAALDRIAEFVGEPLDIDTALREKRQRETGSDVLPYMLEERLIMESRP